MVWRINIPSHWLSWSMVVPHWGVIHDWYRLNFRLQSPGFPIRSQVCLPFSLLWEQKLVMIISRNVIYIYCSWGRFLAWIYGWRRPRSVRHVTFSHENWPIDIIFPHSVFLVRLWLANKANKTTAPPPPSHPPGKTYVSMQLLLLTGVCVASVLITVKPLV